MTTSESTETIEETGTVNPPLPPAQSESHGTNPDAPASAVDKVRVGQHFGLVLVAKEEKGMPVLDLSEGDLPKEVIVDILINIADKLMHDLGASDFVTDSRAYIEKLAEHRRVSRQQAAQILMSIIMEGPNALQHLLGGLGLPDGMPAVVAEGTGQYI